MIDNKLAKWKQLDKLCRERRPFPRKVTMAEKKCGHSYEKCNNKFGCPDGEECWFDSEDYWFDCGQGQPLLSEYKEVGL